MRDVELLRGEKPAVAIHEVVQQLDSKEAALRGRQQQVLGSEVRMLQTDPMETAESGELDEASLQQSR